MSRLEGGTGGGGEMIYGFGFVVLEMTGMMMRCFLN